MHISNYMKIIEHMYIIYILHAWTCFQCRFLDQTLLHSSWDSRQRAAPGYQELTLPAHWAPMAVHLQQLWLILKWCNVASLTYQIGDFPWKTPDFPSQTGDFPWKTRGPNMVDPQKCFHVDRRVSNLAPPLRWSSNFPVGCNDQGKITVPAPFNPWYPWFRLSIVCN